MRIEELAHLHSEIIDLEAQVIQLRSRRRQMIREALAEGFTIDEIAFVMNTMPENVLKYKAERRTTTTN